MHARIVRRAVRSAAVVAAVTGTLTWAPAATAQPAAPTPSASTASTETPAPDGGHVAITTKDPAGDVLKGASFLLLDAVGQEAGRGKTDAQGKLAIPNLAPGVYRLKETATGSPLHDVVADQDVIVTPGATTPVTITDPFKTAHIQLTAKDDKTSKPLPGATMTIGTGGTTLLTLTTGPNGTASGELPVSSGKQEFWVKEIKAPEGYDIYKPSKTFTAAPAAPVTVTVTNTKTSTTPTSDPTNKTTDKPSGAPATPEDKPSHATPGGPKPTPTDSATLGADSSPASAADDATPKAPAGSLAHTGADATPWILGAAGLLLAGGIGALVAARRRAATESEQDGGGETR
ncbi:LPXTG cell wall anchor domain-containing protein [Streptomyces sp. ET3-23]|uniref:carboxypeptidase-like regulatory domain-containing protein n=1 Tax=Streptomyces sp. ET3-23 TaxID=2885643 RepID=UPI001D11A14E|nr:carboxypeptidase-like regulatory domain-containing protein [Streptomyces sp. ET3-23]MCC2276194.1 LPXTG cell wall anchor domain-containing protein [Streptomyces sp. ET3-23]